MAEQADADSVDDFSDILEGENTTTWLRKHTSRPPRTRGRPGIYQPLVEDTANGI